MIIALFGGSACGKTTLAKIVGSDLAIPVRHCGEEYMNALNDAGGRSASTAEHIHRLVDQETRRWCLEIGSDVVVDGRFLDQVLSDLPNVLFIEVHARIHLRARRLTERFNRHISEDELRAIDEEDDSFRSRMYPDVSRARRAHMVDSGGGSALECGEKLISVIARLRAAPLG